MRVFTSITLIALCFVVVAASGCGNTQRERGGGSDSNSSFTLSGPAGATPIMQGDTHTVMLNLDRGKDFDQTVKFAVDAPAGLEPNLDENSLPPSAKGAVRVKIAVADDAPLGDHTIKVTGTPEKGKEATLAIKVRVKERVHDDTRGLALTGPASLTIREGETQTAQIMVIRSKDYAHKVQLSADAPFGIYPELSKRSLATADKGEVEISITAIEHSAPSGMSIVRVIATPDEGSPVSMEIKVNVPAK